MKYFGVTHKANIEQNQLGAIGESGTITVYSELFELPAGDYTSADTLESNALIIPAQSILQNVQLLRSLNTTRLKLLANGDEFFDDGAAQSIVGNDNIAHSDVDIIRSLSSGTSPFFRNYGNEDLKLTLAIGANKTISAAEVSARTNRIRVIAQCINI